MRISVSSYDAFWVSPERYRLSRVVEPCDTPAPLRQGIAFHAVLEAARVGWDAPAIDAMLAGKRPTPGGEILTLRAAEGEDVLGWFATWSAKLPALDVVAVEAWFDTPLPRGHSLLGRVDGIVRRADGLWVHEVKTDRYANLESAEREWPRRMQMRAEVIGARALGHDVNGVLLDLVGKQGSRACHRIELRYADAELEAARADLAHTCDMIDALRLAAPDGPWPHPARTWPCSVVGRCEYEAVCGRAGAPEPDGLTWRAATRPVLPEGLGAKSGKGER